jgi:hypothetical protein
MKIKIDHVTLCGSSLEELRKALADAGLATDYGGPHTNQRTHMALLGFEDGSYLELIAPMTRTTGFSGFMAGWIPFMNADAGAGAWAIQTSNIREEGDRLQAAGVNATIPEPGGRKKDEGNMLRWQTASIGPGAAGSLLPFMIQDETPRELRVQPSKGARGTGLTGVEIVVLGVGELTLAIACFRKAYGWDSPRTEVHSEFGASLAHFPNTPVVLAAPLDEDSWLAARLKRFGDCPLAFLLHTPDLALAARQFHLVRADTWFGRHIAWFDESKLRGARLGVIE